MAFTQLDEWKGGTVAELIVHQDKGSPYTIGDYVTAVLESHAYVSYSRPATPGDNPVNEAFFSCLKAEWDEQLVEAETFDALYSTGKPGNCLLQRRKVSYEYWVSNTRSV